MMILNMRISGSLWYFLDSPGRNGGACFGSSCRFLALEAAGQYNGAHIIWFGSYCIASVM